MSIIKKDSKLITILSIIMSIIVLIATVLISSHVFDLSYDGNAYHKEAILAIDRGWNPIYEDYSEFCDDNNLSSIHELWVTTYPKATWIIADSIYKLTKNIESGKAINIIMMYISFGICSYLFYKVLSRKVCSLILGFLASVNPIVVSQIFSYYLDGFMGLVFFLVCFSMALYVIDDKSKVNNLILMSSLIILVNCKFTGLAYASIFCLSFYCYYLYCKIKNREYKNIKNSICYFTVTVILAVLLVGSNTYVKNLADYHNPLYPLMGKDKVDIMTSLQPASFKDMSPIQKNYYSIFSRSANIGVFNNGEPELKIPFTYSNYELTQLDTDTRIGGYGVLFSGIFVLSILIIAIYLIFNHQNTRKPLVLIPITVNILLLFFLSDGWWARYSPWLYLFILIALTMLAGTKNKIISILLIIFSLLISYNTFLCSYKIISHDIPISGFTREKIKSLSGEEINIFFEIENLSGIRANLLDYDIKYTVVTDRSENMEALYGNTLYYEKSN